MPKAVKDAPSPISRTSVMVVRYRTTRVFMPHSKTFKALGDDIRAKFKLPPETNLRFLAALVGMPDEQRIELVKGNWSSSHSRIKVIKVELAEYSRAALPPVTTSKGPENDDNPTSKSTNVSDNNNTITLVFKHHTYPRGVFRAQARRNVALDGALNALSLRLAPKGYVRFLYGEERIEEGDTPDRLGMKENDVIEYMIEQIGGKPVIYLYPVEEMDVRVRLALTPQWRFSALYPPVAVCETGDVGQEVEWNVRAYPSGVMNDIGTGFELAYLFWEAETDSSVMPASPASMDGAISSAPVEAFIPIISDCSPSNSVLLHAGAVPLYLDRALSALGLHVEAKTSFITYWLPSILKHQHVALRFVNQKAYENAAPLTITPQPDVVTRIFMLFQGIKSDRVDAWNEAKNRATADVTFWREVIGVPEGRLQKDFGLFRVLEWGGMEVIQI